MSQSNLDIQQALGDIAIIRRVLDQADQDQVDAKLVGVTLSANLVLQIIAFTAALVFLVLEVGSGHSITDTLNSSINDAGQNLLGIGLMGFIIAGLLVVMYFILWRASRHNGEEIVCYISRNFKYVKNLSFISDLLMKYIALSLLILAGKPEWIAPMLIAFTGDYLLQGRLFTLPTKLSIGLGVGCIGAAAYLFLNHIDTLSIPLLAFALVAGTSVARLLIRQHSQASE